MRGMAGCAVGILTRRGVDFSLLNCDRDLISCILVIAVTVVGCWVEMYL